MNRSKWIILLILIALPTVMRITGKPWNFAPVGAIALFAGVHFRNKLLAILLPLVAVFASDVYLGIQMNDIPQYTFHTLAPVIYGSFLFYVAFGMGVRRFWNAESRHSEQVTGNSNNGHLTARKAAAIPAGAIAGAIAFFLVTNFAVWAVFPTYSHTIQGLMNCYVAGLPYFRMTVLGDLFFAAILFGGYELLRIQVPAWQRSTLMYANE